MHSQTAPNPIETVKDEIRDQRRHLSRGRTILSENRTDNHLIGKFQAVAGATVETDLNIVFSRRWKKVGLTERENTVKFAATVRCTGHGCADPVHEVPATGEFLLDGDADETAPAAQPVIDAARKWAQQHAETCRALPYSRY
ncbi:hypothetical protein [Streptomyces sp. NPDC047981]|uniref:hypothetical protein n=1 Tax=Streptomyces sp. NPDC047981 TaxID=3154610 RepID=UPI0034303614